MNRSRRILSEPLLHFLLLGAALFAAYYWLGEEDAPGEEQIVVSAGKIDHLATLYEQTWQRPPTRAELETLVEDYIREEAAYREGLAMGLELDDTIIRRRIRQKFDFAAEDLAGQTEPAEEELAAYLAAHPDEFRIEPRLSLRQVYFNPDRHGDNLDAEIRDLLISLNGDPSIDAAALGDRILLEHNYDDVSTRDLVILFGTRFSEAVALLEPGQWQGPIPSAYGMHAVIVDERREGRLPELAEVRAAVLREWQNMRREEMIEQVYRDLLGKYEIVIQWPASGETPGLRSGAAAQQAQPPDGASEGLPGLRSGAAAQQAQSPDGILGEADAEADANVNAAAAASQENAP